MDYDLLFIAFVSLVASCIGTMTGFGTSTIMVPILLSVLPFDQTLFLVAILHWFSNLWRIIIFEHGFRWKLILGFGIPGIIASYYGGSLVFKLSHEILTTSLGIVLIFYVALVFYEYFSKKTIFHFQPKLYNAALGGISSGFISGVLGSGGAARTMFLLPFNLPKEVYIGTAGAIALLVDSARLFSYYRGGSILETNIWWGMLTFIPASIVGTIIAKKLVGKIPQERFKLFVAIFLALIGLKLLFN